MAKLTPWIFGQDFQTWLIFLCSCNVIWMVIGKSINFNEIFAHKIFLLQFYDGFVPLVTLWPSGLSDNWDEGWGSQYTVAVVTEEGCWLRLWWGTGARGATVRSDHPTTGDTAQWESSLRVGRPQKWAYQQLFYDLDKTYQQFFLPHILDIMLDQSG